MKKFIAILASLFIIVSVSAQAPEQMNYQAVARDLSGLPLVSTAVNLQFDILQGSATGSVAYSETQSKTTNQFGLFTAEIGAGTVVSGSFPGMAWGTNVYFLRITVNGDVMPATQLLSVPYALYAKTSGGAGAGLVAGPGIDITGGVITSTSDTSSTNEFQTLTTNATNDTVFLSNNGGFVYIPAIAGDDWGADTVNTSGLNILGSGTVANPLIVVDNDTSLTNELQNLTWNTTDSNIINISNGSGIPLSSNTPSTNQVLTWNGANWIAQSVGGSWTQGTGNDIYNNTDSVGIGVVDPKALLHVSGGGIGKPIALFESGSFLNSSININSTSSNGSGINFQNGATTTSSITSSTANVLSLTSQFVEVGNSPKTGKLNVASTSSLTNPTLLLHETSTGYSRIKHTNTVAGSKYWVTEAGINATDALSGYSIGYENGGGTVLPLVVYGDSKVGVNNLATPLSSLHVMDNTANGGIVSEGFSQEGAMIIARNNFTFPNRGAVQNGDVLGVLSFSGHDGTGFGKGPQLKATATENFTTTSNGSELSFSTIVNGTNTDQNVLRLLNDGTVEVPVNLRVLNGAGTAGDVLTSDAAGNATWQAASGGGNDTSLIDADGDTHINVESAPDQDVIHFNLGNNAGYPSAEYFTMIGPRLEVINSGRSVFMGEGAGTSSDITTNRSAVAIGYNALNANVSGNFGVAIGAYSQQNTTASNNVSVGRFTLSTATTATNLTAIGSDALRFNTSGSENTALGVGASGNNTTGSNNTSVGYVAGGNTDVGAFNTSVGSSALLYNILGNSNTAVGYLSLINTTANNNVGLGRGAGITNTTGVDNTFLGYGSDASVNNLTNATAIGANSLVSQNNSLILGNNADVGIGTSVPTAKLDVLSPSGSADNIVKIGEVGTTNKLKMSSGTTAYTFGGGDGSVIRHDITVHHATGNVGIGLGTLLVPNARLDVAGGIETDDLRVLTGAGTVGDVLTSDAAGNATWQAAGGSSVWNLSGTDINYIAGNVGIGISAPTSLLHMQTPTTANVLLESTTGGDVAYTLENVNTDYSWRLSGVNLTLYHGGTNVITTVSDNVGIGNAGPGFKLDVTGDINTTTFYRIDGTTFLDNRSTSTLVGATGNAILTGVDNTFLGQSAGENSTSASENTFLGKSSGNSNTTGSQNVAIGVNSSHSNVLGWSNIAVGFEALNSNTTSGNTGVGHRAMHTNTTGIQNVAFGYLALATNATANANTAIGYLALENTTGDNNTGLGYAAGNVNTTGTNNTFIGHNANALTGQGGLTNATAIGSNATVNTSNSLILGNNANVGIGTSSPSAKLDVDGTFKLKDGTEGVGKILTSDAAGNATWQNLPPSISFSANTSTTSIPAGTTTALIYDNVEYDNGTNFNVATGQFVSPETGVYHIDAVVTFDASSTHEIQLQILRNGGTHKTVVVYADPTNNYTTAHISADVYLPVLNNVSIGIYQNSGGNINPSGTVATSRVYFTGHLVR